MASVPAIAADYDRLKTQLAVRADDFRAALPAHITPEKFQRTVITAVQTNPDLLRADRASFITSCMKAAQDGLLPDGREAALVTFSTSKKDANGQWSKMLLVQYMPMVYGVRKKILQSGEVADIQTAVVYRQEIEAGLFIYEEGTERTLRHKPLLDPSFDPTDDDIAAAYSIATMKDGSKSFEVMPRREINKIRQASQTGAVGRTTRDGRKIEPKGPWVDWFSEMARKSVMRRHSKTLPMSGDIIDVEAMDDAIAARSATAALASVVPERPVSLPSRGDLAAQVEHDPVTGEIVQEDDNEQNQPPSPEAARPADTSSQGPETPAMSRADAEKFAEKYTAAIAQRDSAIALADLSQKHAARLDAVRAEYPDIAAQIVDAEIIRLGALEQEDVA